MDLLVVLLDQSHIRQMVVDMVETEQQETLLVVMEDLVGELDLTRVMELHIQEEQQINLQVDHLLDMEILVEQEDIKVESVKMVEAEVVLD